HRIRSCPSVVPARRRTCDRRDFRRSPAVRAGAAGRRYPAAAARRRVEDDLPLPGPTRPGRPGIAQGGPMAWLSLFFAGLLEVVWAFSMKQSAGFTRLVPSVVTAVAMVASFALLAFSMRQLPLGTAYTVWTGIGAVGAFIAGAAFLGEPLSPMRVTAAALIVAGLVLMKLSS